jgi:hypothetical protein
MCLCVVDDLDILILILYPVVFLTTVVNIKITELFITQSMSIVYLEGGPGYALQLIVVC